MNKSKEDSSGIQNTNGVMPIHRGGAEEAEEALRVTETPAILSVSSIVNGIFSTGLMKLMCQFGCRQRQHHVTSLLTSFQFYKDASWCADKTPYLRSTARPKTPRRAYSRPLARMSSLDGSPWSCRLR
jgi:hypothetical protein